MENKKPNLNDLFEDLAHPNPNISKKAYLGMAVYCPEESIPRLLSNFDSSDISLRRISIKALGAFGIRAIQPLIEMFYLRKDRVIRTSCLKAFLQLAVYKDIGDLPDEVITIVELALQPEQPELILTAISLLKQLGKQGLPLLLITSKDSNILKAMASVTVLGESDDPLAEKCLRNLMEDPSIDELLLGSIKESLSHFC